MEKTPDFMPSLVRADSPIWEDPSIALALCKAIIDNAIAAFVMMDVNGICVEWNRQAEKTFGWTRNEALGKAVADLIVPPEIRDLHWAGLKRFKEHGNGPLLNRTIEAQGVCKDDQKLPISLTIVPMPWNGQPLFAAFIADISAQKQAMAKLQASYDQLAREMGGRIRAEDKAKHLEKALENSAVSPVSEAKMAANKLMEVADRIRANLGEQEIPKKATK